MNDNRRKDESPDQDSGISKRDYAARINSKAIRKLNARRNAAPGVWFGLGMMGLIGWSVVIPTLAGAGIGLWIDRHHPDSHSWTLALLIGGLTLGCINAWHWVDQEGKTLREELDNDDNP